MSTPAPLATARPRAPFHAFFYNFVVLPLLYLAFRLLSLFHKKVRRGIRGRRALFPRLAAALQAFPARRTRLLLHAASMGEFEQTRPVLRELRRQFPDWLLCVSVYSPSAFEHIQKSAEFDLLTYLPFDTRRAARKFLDRIAPAALLITRHDLWPNLLWEAKKRGICTILIDASVHPGSLRHKPLVRSFNRTVFAAIDQICAISAPAAAGMQKLLPDSPSVHITGDTRFDQVVFRSTETPLAEILPPAWIAPANTLVAGSVWPEDEAQLLPACARLRRRFPSLRIVLVPHETDEAHLQQSEARCRTLSLAVQRLSAAESSPADVLLVDRMGVLANLYAAGAVAYVGGSFGPGVHSVIEAAAHRVPVLFGPRMTNSAEAVEMVAEACGFIVRNRNEIFQTLQRFFTDRAALETAAQKAAEFVAHRTGASARILEIVRACLQE